MNYQVILPKHVEKKLNGLDKKIQLRMEVALLHLQSDPYCGKKLEGKYKNCYSLRVWPYRVIYEIIRKKLVILIIDIGHRQGVY